MTNENFRQVFSVVDLMGGMK